MQETPLKEEHEKLGARMVDFAGWLMPVVYSNIKEEHRRVRSKAGLFDVSHMGRYHFTGPDHVKFIDRLITNDRAGMKHGRIRYALILNDSGGILDDVLVYSMGDEGTMLVVNAGNRPVITDWIERQREGFDVQFDDRSEEYAMIAMQGPESNALMARISGLDVDALKYYRFTRASVLDETDCMVSRTGYTGEDGFEVIMPADKATGFWREMLNQGEDLGAGPAGLGARDTLRLEAGMPLHGHEIDAETNPLEANLGWAVKLDKGDFIGREATVALKESGLKRQLAGLNVEGKRIPRQGQAVTREGNVVGEILSGTLGPWVDKIVATAFLPPELAEPGTPLEIPFRSKAGADKSQKAEVVPMPFYRRKKKQ